ncbi:MAG: hypothetical protein LBK26_00850 [Rickettsiales bacterium]|jgi:hypothetical protein|nr:hypothetical protein [Rickettsiales bacterium]
MHSLKRIFIVIFPFAITLLLWRLSIPVWNPCGILAAIPIFYYSFISERPGFLPMAILGCLLLDYNFDLMLFWTSMFCIAYAANYMQTLMRAATLQAAGFWTFSSLIGICLAILGIHAFFSTWSAAAILQAIWMFVLTTAGYVAWVKIGRVCGQQLTAS